MENVLEQFINMTSDRNNILIHMATWPGVFLIEFSTAVIYAYIYIHLFHLRHCVHIYSNWLREQFRNLSLSTLHILSLQ